MRADAQQRSQEPGQQPRDMSGTGGWLAGGGRAGIPTARHAGNVSWDGAGGMRDAVARSAREPLRTPTDVSSDQDVL